MFRKAIFEAFQWNYKFYLSSFSSSVGTFFFFEREFQFTTFRSLRYGIAIFAFSFIIRTIYNYIIKVDALEKVINEKDKTIEIIENSQSKYDLIRKHNYYGEVLIAMKDIFSQINKLKRNQDISKKDITDQLVRVSNRVKSIFEKRLNYNYSVSIKVIIKENDIPISENSEVETIIRDEASYFQRKDNVKNGHKHFIKDNTCYSEVMNNIEFPSKSFFISNNLVGLLGYINSSSKDYGNIPIDIENDKKEEYWTLPYKSEIVVPISPILHNSEKRKNHFYGFLCVDCDEKDAFHKKYDTSNLIGIADGLSDLLNIWVTIKNKEQNGQ